MASGVCSRFPRSIDRGLIEARAPHDGRADDHHLPGLLIGASLKQNPQHLDTSGQAPFPRSIDRGLIEAHAHGRQGCGACHFPRSIDRGLIEASTTGAAWARRTYFPGLLIGASLKLCVVRSLFGHVLISPVY